MFRSLNDRIPYSDRYTWTRTIRPKTSISVLRRYQHLTKLPDSLMDGLTTMKSAISQLKQSKTYKIQKATGIHSQLPNQIRPACKMNIYIYKQKSSRNKSPSSCNEQIINVTLSPNKKNTAPSFRHCYFQFGQFVVLLKLPTWRYSSKQVGQILPDPLKP